ncbi:MAG TPA: 4-hydroxy-tetrahydrodipicolinate synthase [Clostridiaceae bacterium]|nr:4-hydroxy-tetrahydrodipicolinate synthase [Clostridiaceae bacterium]
MKKSKFGRVLLPFITPFDKNGDVDYDTLCKLINYAIEKDFLDTVVVTGTTGEFNTLTTDERIQIFRTAVKAVNGRVPIIAGTGAASTRETITLTKAAEEAGIDTVMIVAPYYCKPTQQGIYDHYIEILNNTTADILLYNIPTFTGININPETVGRLAAVSKRFIGIKDQSSINPVQIIDYRNAVFPHNKEFLIYNGDDAMLLPTMACGADGIVSGGSLVLGDKVKQVFKYFEEGRNEEAFAVFQDVFKLGKIYSINGRIHPIPILRVAVEMTSGIKVGPSRPPLDYPTNEEIEAVRSLLSEMKLI